MVATMDGSMREELLMNGKRAVLITFRAIWLLSIIGLAALFGASLSQGNFDGLLFGGLTAASLSFFWHVHQQGAPA